VAPARPAALRTGETMRTVTSPVSYTPKAPTTGTDDYRCFVLDPGLARDAFVTGFAAWAVAAVDPGLGPGPVVWPVGWSVVWPVTWPSSRVCATGLGVPHPAASSASAASAAATTGRPRRVLIAPV
jgi:hypothetical protein